MLRDCELKDISDGRLYGENDMVKADTGNCSGCRSYCCRNVGKTIILDPLDVYRLTAQLECTFEQLLENRIELNMVDGLILPNLKIANDKPKSGNNAEAGNDVKSAVESGESGRCSFLEGDMCGIHNNRPGICRLFPLGRYWEDDEHFKYILQTGQCIKDNLTKIKVKKWLDTPGLAEYNKFIVSWHAFIKKLQRAEAGLTQEQIRVLTMYVLKTFYQTPYKNSQNSAEEFYSQYYERLNTASKTLALE